MKVGHHVDVCQRGFAAGQFTQCPNTIFTEPYKKSRLSTHKGTIFCDYNAESHKKTEFRGIRLPVSLEVAQSGSPLAELFTSADITHCITISYFIYIRSALHLYTELGASIGEACPIYRRSKTLLHRGDQASSQPPPQKGCLTGFPANLRLLTKISPFFFLYHGVFFYLYSLLARQVPTHGDRKRKNNI